MKTVRQIFSVRPERHVDSGDLGVEIEVEGSRLPMEMANWWRVDHDGSLQGESAEYVLNRPRTLTGVERALNYLRKKYEERGTKVVDSVRTGVHVHVNVQALSLVELYNFMTIYIMLEEALVKFCGESREGNLFCLRVQDADYLTHILSECIKRKKFGPMYSDDLRYASMNVKSLHEYGSLEFRAMRGTEDFDQILLWCKTLLRLREMAKAFDNPIDIVSGMSGNGIEPFVRHILGDCHEVITRFDDYEQMVFSGMRNAQDVAFSVDWDQVKNPVQKNPFKQGAMFTFEEF